MKLSIVAIASGLFGILAIGSILLKSDAFMNESKSQQPLATNIKKIGFTIASLNSLENLPNGTYAYKERKVPHRIDTSMHLVFRKTGNTAVGYFFQNYTDNTYCFKGRLQSQSLIDVTIAETVMGKNSSKYTFSRAGSADLMNFQLTSLKQAFSTSPRVVSHFNECLDLFGNS